MRDVQNKDDGRSLVFKLAAGACQILILVGAYLIVGPPPSSTPGHVAGGAATAEGFLLWLGKYLGVVILASIVLTVGYYVVRGIYKARTSHRRRTPPSSPGDEPR